MSGRYFLGAYWPARRESIERCAERLRAFFMELVACDRSLAQWYREPVRRDQPPQRPIDLLDTVTLLQLLERGRNRENVTRTVTEELGFQIVLWNGQKAEKKASLRVHCGLYWQSPSPNASLSNAVVLNFPEELGALAEAQRMVQVLTAVALAWEPEWAGIISEAAMKARDFDVVPFVDWMVFLPRKIGSLPAPSFVKELHGRGSIIVVQPTPPSEGNTEGTAVIRRVEEAIAKEIQ